MNVVHPWKKTIDFYYGKAGWVNCMFGFNYFCQQTNDFKDKAGGSTSNNKEKSPTNSTFHRGL